jgi:hypothetical protein
MRLSFRPSASGIYPTRVKRLACCAAVGHKQTLPAILAAYRIQIHKPGNDVMTTAATGMCSRRASRQSRMAKGMAGTSLMTARTRFRRSCFPAFFSGQAGGFPALDASLCAAVSRTDTGRAVVTPSLPSGKNRL